MFQVSADRVSPFCTSALVNGATLHMEVDTGAALSLISKATYHRLWPTDVAPELQEVKINLRTYTGEELVVLGSAQVRVQYKEQPSSFLNRVLCFSMTESRVSAEEG